MGRTGFVGGGRTGTGSGAPSSRDHRRKDPPRSRGGATDSASGSSRLLLTRLLRDGAIWNVYIGTIAQSGASNRTQLEFEDASTKPATVRHTRRVGGPLLEALFSGAPVSRASLLGELELALRDAGTAQSGPAPTLGNDETSTAAAPAAPDEAR